MKLKKLALILASSFAYFSSEAEGKLNKRCNPLKPRCGVKLRKNFCKVISEGNARCTRRLEAGEVCDPAQIDEMQCFSKNCVDLAGTFKCACLNNKMCRSQMPTVRLKNRSQCVNNECILTTKELARTELNKDIGESCATDFECVSGKCESNTCIGSVFMRAYGGETCTDHQGCRSGECRAGICACDRNRKNAGRCAGEAFVCGGDGNCMELKLGGVSCTLDEECVSGGCKEGVCSCRDGSNAVSCDSASQFCGSVDGKAYKMCFEKKLPNAECGVNKECVSNVCTNQNKCACEEDSDCTETDEICISQSGLCEKPVGNGESCSINRQCVSGNCASGTCDCPTCSGNEYCSSENNACEAIRGVGEMCESNEACLTGLCDGTCQCIDNGSCNAGETCMNGDCLKNDRETCVEDSDCATSQCLQPTGSSTSYCGLAPGSATCGSDGECISGACRDANSLCRCENVGHCQVGQGCVDRYCV